MQIVTCKDWSDFLKVMDKYTQLPLERRNELWFRGQASEQDALLTTLDRQSWEFEGDEDRQKRFWQLLDEFKSEAIRLQFDDRFTCDIDKLELLARHYGLPSPLLDWTQSPYVAAYFAFSALQNCSHDIIKTSRSVCVWMVDLSKLELDELDFQLINEIDKIEGNPRALKQKGVFMRINTGEKPVTKMLEKGLCRFDIPGKYRYTALASLDEMMINGSTLYNDLNGAAQTAMHRVGEHHDNY